MPANANAKVTPTATNFQFTILRTKNVEVLEGQNSSVV